MKIVTGMIVTGKIWFPLERIIAVEKLRLKLET